MPKDSQHSPLYVVYNHTTPLLYNLASGYLHLQRNKHAGRFNE